MKQVIYNKRFKRHNKKDTPQVDAQEAEDRRILTAMGCSRDPDDCNMKWYREQYNLKLGVNNALANECKIVG